ncbi:MAG: hypothetical protein KAX77_00775 [Xanthomonadales bacterium]|nr:hypothetical protein [Xanthomonadales bacterium]
MIPTTPAYKAQVASQFHNGRVEHSTYISAPNQAAARTALEREGFDVICIRLVELTHLGGQLA